MYVCKYVFYCVSIHSDVSDLLKGTVQDNVNSSIGQLARSLDGVSPHMYIRRCSQEYFYTARTITPKQQNFCQFLQISRHNCSMYLCLSVWSNMYAPDGMSGQFLELLRAKMLPPCILQSASVHASDHV